MRFLALLPLALAAGCTAQQLAGVQAAPVALDPFARALDAVVPGAGAVLTAAGIVAAAAASFLAHRKASTAHVRISKAKRERLTNGGTTP